MTTDQLTRKAHQPIVVYCLPGERALIEANAKAAGKKVGPFLRAIGQGYTVTGKVDYDAVLELARINGDLGRLGGLLKMWLADDPRMLRFSDKHILALLSKIELVAQTMPPVMKQLVLRTRDEGRNERRDEKDLAAKSFAPATQRNAEGHIADD